MKKWCNDQKIQWRCIGGESKNHIDDCHGNTLNVLNLVLRINSTGYYSFSQGIDVTETLFTTGSIESNILERLHLFLNNPFLTLAPKIVQAFLKNYPQKLFRNCLVDLSTSIA